MHKKREVLSLYPTCEGLIKGLQLNYCNKVNNDLPEQAVKTMQPD